MSVLQPINFAYTSNFPSLSTNQIQAGIDFIEATWSGIFTLFSLDTQTVQQAKQAALENLLVAWYLADLFPTQVVGITGTGGQIIKRKEVGGNNGVKIEFSDIAGRLSNPAYTQLFTNSFGEKAYTILMSSPERYMIYG